MARARATRRVDELLVLPIGDFILVEKEGRNRYFVCRALIFLIVIAPHQESSTFDVDHSFGDRWRLLLH